MAKIAITGASGFIGFHTAKKLKSVGYEVIGFDNYNDYYEPSLKENRTKELKKHDVNITRGDLMDISFLNKFMKEHKPDLVLHLAAYANVRHSFVEPEKYLDNNIKGTHNLIESLVENNISK